MKLKVFDIMKE